MVPKSHHSLTLSPESIGGGVRGAMPLEYLEEDYEAGVDALPQQLRFGLSEHLRVQLLAEYVDCEEKNDI